MPKSTSNLSGAASSHARRLAGDQRLIVQDVDEARFDELRLRQRRGDAQDRLVGEEHGAFGMACTSPVKRNRGEIIEKIFAEPAGALKPGDVGWREAKVFQKIERLLESGGHQKSAPRGRLRTNNSNTAVFGIAMVQISLDHVDLIKVRQQRTDFFHRGAFTPCRPAERPAEAER